MLTYLRNRCTTLDFQIKAGSLLLVIIPSILIMFCFFLLQWQPFYKQAAWGLWIIAVVLTIVYLTIWRLARRIQMLIMSLIEAASQIKAGNNNYQIKDSHYINCFREFKELCEAFNQMAIFITVQEASMKGYNDYLEKKVTNRTIELARMTLEKRKSVEKLENSENRSRALLKSMPDLFFWVSKSGDYLDVSAAKIELLPVPAESYKGRNIRDTLPEEIAGVMAEMIVRVIESKQEESLEYSIIIRGKKIYEESRITAIGPAEALIIVRDVTERILAAKKNREMSYKLSKSQEIAALGVMAGSFAHEINQPLNSIKVSASGLQYLYKKGHYASNTENISEIMEEINEIACQVNRIEAVINNIRDSMRKDASVRTVCQLNEVVSASLKTVCSNHWCKGIIIKTEYAPNLPTISGNQIHMDQIIFNLISNAVQALESCTLKDYKEIKIATYYTNYVTLEFCDNGPGLDREKMEMIFEPLFTTKSGSKNMGLGLSIVKSIVKVMGGKISVSNRMEGGASFKIELPTYQQQ